LPAEDCVKLTGTVVELLPNTTFKVKVPKRDDPIMAYLSGRMRKAKIKIILGDEVDVEFSTYDLNQGRIVYRIK
jgi:translation initiation factor IF-1